jgi:hypothetical protein
VGIGIHGAVQDTKRGGKERDVFEIARRMVTVKEDQEADTIGT